MSPTRSSPHRLDSLPDLNPQSLYRPHLRPLDLASDVAKTPSPRRTNQLLLTPPLTPSSSFSSQNTPSTPTDSTSSFVHDYQDIQEPAASRLLLVRNVPKNVNSDALKRLFKPCGAIKGILIRFQTLHGVVVIAFYDVRDAQRAKTFISSTAIDGSLLTARLISSLDLRKLSSGPNNFIDECEGKLQVVIEDGFISADDLRDLLASFGHLQSFNPALDKSYYAEYFDCRCAQSAVDNLNNLMISGARLRATIMYDGDKGSSTRSLSVDSESPPPSTQPTTPIVKASDLEKDKSYARGLFFDSSGRVRPRSVSAGESGKPKNIVALREASSTELHSRRSSNTLFFDAVGKPQKEEQSDTVSGQRRASAPDVSLNEPAVTTYPYDYSHSYSHHHHPYPHPQPHGFARYDDPTSMAYHQHQHHQHHQHPAYPTYPYSYAPENPYVYTNLSNWEYSSPVVPHVPHSPAVHSPEYYLAPTAIDTSVSPEYSPVARSPISPTTPSKSFGPRLQTQASTLHARAPGAPPPPPPPERNLLNVQKIEEGLDTRTTVMVKNIPNKMSDKDLLAFIAKVCPRKIDFLYLRMDFQNGCNVGYAFVNFITVQDLLLFAKSKLGVKWNMYSSEKVLQMSYANYQGKEALIEKFKNSCIMDERESYRPKIFYSNGAKQGLAEPFPAPTHLRRKERSSNNRGALFVGTNGAYREARAVSAV